MCQFKSFIITKNEIYHDLDEDSHEKLIEIAGLNDKTRSPNFVRVGILPIDNDIFNHKKENWRISVDQDFRPDWFCEKEALEACWPKMLGTFKERFISKGKIEKIEKGRWFLSGSAEVGVLHDSCILCGVYSSAAKWSLKDKSIAILRYETSTRIVTAEKGTKLDIF